MTSLTYRLYIDGTWQDSEGDAVLTVLNPATEEVIGAVPDATAGDVNRAVAAARRAFDEGPWPSFSPRERAAVMLRMADAMQRRARGAAGQRQRVRPRRRRLGPRPGACLRDRQAHQGRDGLRQRRRGRVEPAHRLWRLQAERPRLERGEYGLDELLLSKSIIWSAR
jgi:hypothetical protein